MPLKGKEPFKRKTPKGIVHLDQELFYCKTTHEVFTTYDDLFERVIECSSLLWSCELTGKGGLTFQEASESEDKARRVLRAIPFQLKRLILTQTEKFNCSRLQELSEKVYTSIQNRYAVGETVEAVISGHKKSYEITDIRTPGSSTKNKSPAKKQSESPKKASPSKLRYEVCEKGAEITVLHVVSPDNMNRPKGSLTKDKTKLFLKQCVDSEDGVLKVKSAHAKKYKLNSASPEKTPNKKIKLDKTPQKVGSVVKNGKSSKSNTPNKVSPVKNALKNSQSPSKIKKTLKSIDADIRKMFPKSGERAPSQMENNSVVPVKTGKDPEAINKQKLARREKKKVETQMLHEYVDEWRRKRDDLECDDLKDLPTPMPINCGIPRDKFGEALAIMEFLHRFSSVLQLKNTFSQGFNLKLMERALTENDNIQGPFGDLVQMLLLSVFKQQESEEEEPDKNGDTPSKDIPENESELMDTDSAVKAANAAISWSFRYHGCSIRRFPLDPFTLTELLRLHLLSSGAEITTLASERGNFKNLDDAGLSFKINNPGLITKLGTVSVFLLTAEERLKVLTLLVDQLITYPAFRDFLKTQNKQLSAARHQLQILRIKRTKNIKSSEAVAPSVEGDESKNPKTKTPDNDEADNNTPAAPAEPRMSAEEEKAQLLQYEKKMQDLKNTISKLEETFLMEPLGADRAHRYYWLFQTVDGIFVEDSNPYPGQCLAKPTPTQLTINGTQEDLPLSFMRKFMAMVHNSHDKENHFKKTNKINHVNS